MCLYISSEVILANILSKKDSVSIREIMAYCEALKEELSNSQRGVYINVNHDELRSALSRCSSEFRFFRGLYFVNNAIKLKHFNARYDDSVSRVLEEVAQRFIS